jgi:hypothetical protein
MRSATGLAILFLASCSTRQDPDRIWRIDSWDHGAFTISHGGLKYTATCDGTVETRNGQTYVNGREFSQAMDQGAEPMCTAAIDLVGRDLETSDLASTAHKGSAKGADGWVTTVLQDGQLIGLFRYRDEKNYFKVMLAVKSVVTVKR